MIFECQMAHGCSYCNVQIAKSSLTHYDVVSVAVCALRIWRLLCWLYEISQDLSKGVE